MALAGISNPQYFCLSHSLRLLFRRKIKTLLNCSYRLQEHLIAST